MSGLSAEIGTLAPTGPGPYSFPGDVDVPPGLQDIFELGRRRRDWETDVEDFAERLTAFAHNLPRRQVAEWWQLVDVVLGPETHHSAAEDLLDATGYTQAQM